ncbi:MAG: tryptophan--tRNA ligase, partial [Candidatus Heimdallarchaeota archaeon]|nr:tryptophan--tRNA ligase [Candidatus Heimdallarchaeota archaeon]
MTNIIDPWGSIQIDDYDKVFDEFGIEKITDTYRENLKHLFFERNIVIGHRDFEKVYDRIINKKPFINMTGIATSGDLHFGHKVIIDLFKFFKDLGARNFFAICDIDGYTSRPNKQIPTMKDAKEYAKDNLAHVLALGLDKKDIYVQSSKPPKYYEFTFEISKKITENMYKAIYTGKDVSVNFGKFSAVILQLADILHSQLPEFGSKMPSITCIALEQDPHLRLVRDVAKKLPYDLETPSALYILHQSGLLEGRKMSSSEPNSAIFLNDD